MARPNVIVLISHDTGRHISPYGVETVRTPNAERLAAQSIRFANHFCNAPQCSPSRAALFTGLYPPATGVHGLSQPPFNHDLKPGAKHAAAHFREMGYDTFGTGAIHESSRREELGFDAIGKKAAVRQVAGELDSWLDSREGSSPFFAELATMETHRPFPPEAIPPDDSLGVTVPKPLRATPATREDYAAYQGSIKVWDEGLGALLDLMEEKGLTENTVLVVTTDHGLAMPLAKSTLYDRGIGVFCIVRLPGGRQGGAAYEGLTSHVDVLPTLLDYCGNGGIARFQGRSLAAALRGEDCPGSAFAFAAQTYHDYYKPMRCIRTEGYKYIRHFSTAVSHMVPGDARQGAYRDNLDIIYGHSQRSYEELYDLEADPDELMDLSEDEDTRQVRIDLATHLVRWMSDIEDPLLNEMIPSDTYLQSVHDLKALLH
jgi:arylsulfatase A-like enzyme